MIKTIKRKLRRSFTNISAAEVSRHVAQSHWKNLRKIFAAGQLSCQYCWQKTKWAYGHGNCVAEKKIESKELLEK